MKLPLLVFAMAVTAFPQSKEAKPPQRAKSCVQRFVGNRKTGTITCINVDKIFADQIGRLVELSRDPKMLAELSSKIDALLNPPPPPPPASAISVSQQGGITAGDVTVNGGPAPAVVSFSEVYSNRKQSGGDGTEVYVSSVRVSLNRAVPVLQITVDAPTLVRMEVLAPGGMAVMGSRRPAVNGSGGQSIQNALGGYVLRLETTAPEHFNIQYSCQGTACFPEASKH